MPKINYDDVWEEDPFHPCVYCGEKEFALDPLTQLYTCCNCGETMVEPTLTNNPKKKNQTHKRKKMDAEDWE